MSLELYSTKFYLLCAAGGAMACGATHFAMTPVDVLKCRKQVGLSGNPGFKGLTVGWQPTLIGYSLQGMFKYGLYEVFKRQFELAVGPENFTKYKDWGYVVSSATAEVFADIALCPWEATKVRMQTSAAGTFPTTLGAGMGKIVSAEGFGGLYKGLVPLWSRQIPYTIMKFWSFERTVELLYKKVVPKPRSECSKLEQLGVSFLGGYIAGIFCTLVSHPADSVVSKMNQYSTRPPLGKVLAELGPAGIWRGLGLRIFMVGTLTGLQWLIYDSFKVAVGLPTTGGAVKK